MSISYESNVGMNEEWTARSAQSASSYELQKPSGLDRSLHCEYLAKTNAEKIGCEQLFQIPKC